MEVEEDGDEVFGVPDRCVKWPCEGAVEPQGKHYRCRDCGTFYGPVEVVAFDRGISTANHPWRK